MRDLCNVMGLDFIQRLRAEVDMSAEDFKSWMAGDLSALSAETTVNVKDYVETLLQERFDRLTELKKKGLAILSYWNVLRVPLQEKIEFSSLVYFVGVDSAEVDEITETNALSMEFIKKVDKEYCRLHEQLDALVTKKKFRLEQILKISHLASNFDAKDASDLVTQLEDLKIQIS
ncbi:unnamed protein product [Urochloa humidicola]